MAETVNKIKNIGIEQYNLFVKEKLADQSKSLNDHIRRNRLPLFSRQKITVNPNIRLSLQQLKRSTAYFPGCTLLATLEMVILMMF